MEEKRFFWRTKNPHIKRIEDKLLKNAFKGVQGSKFLEVGSGSGANFVFLKKHFSDLTGLDISKEALLIASHNISWAKFLESRAENLPFSDNTFDVVFMRDVLHHLSGDSERVLALREMKRVCKKEGRIVIIEPNYYNFVVFIQNLLQREERGLKSSKTKKIKELLRESSLRKIKIEYCEPMPFDRFVLHFRLGFPWLAYFPLVRYLLRFFDFIYKIVVPKRYWAYIIFKVEKT